MPALMNSLHTPPNPADLAAVCVCKGVSRCLSTTHRCIVCPCFCMSEMTLLTDLLVVVCIRVCFRGCSVGLVGGRCGSRWDPDALGRRSAGQPAVRLWSAGQLSGFKSLLQLWCWPWAMVLYVVVWVRFCQGFVTQEELLGEAKTILISSCSHILMKPIWTFDFQY